MAAAIVVPVQLIVSGIGLERLTSPYWTDPGQSRAVHPHHRQLLRDRAARRRGDDPHAPRGLRRPSSPTPAAAFRARLDAFAPLFLAVLISAAGIAVGLAALVLPGLYLLVRWLFVAQCVVIEDKRGFDALARSSQLVRDNWWRAFGIVLATQLIAAIPAILVSVPLGAAAESVDRELPRLAGDMLVDIVTVPFVAIVITLLYYDLLARREQMLVSPLSFRPGRSLRRSRLAPPVLLGEHELLGQRGTRGR